MKRFLYQFFPLAHSLVKSYFLYRLLPQSAKDMNNKFIVIFPWLNSMTKPQLCPDFRDIRHDFHHNLFSSPSSWIFCTCSKIKFKTIIWLLKFPVLIQCIIFFYWSFLQKRSLFSAYSRTSLTQILRWLELNFLFLNQNVIEIYPDNSNSLLTRSVFHSLQSSRYQGSTVKLS